MSSTSSMPTLMRTVRFHSAPVAGRRWRRWVVLAGWMTSVRTSPMLARWLAAHRVDETCAGVTTPRTPNANPSQDRRADRCGTSWCGATEAATARTPRGVVGQPLGHPRGVGDVGRHAFGSVWTALQQLERRLRGEACAEVAQLFAAHLGQEAELAEVAPPTQPAIGRHRLGHLGESSRAPSNRPESTTTPRACLPCPRGTSSPSVRRRRRLFDGTAQRGCRDGGVHHEWHPGIAGHRRQPHQVGDLPRGVGDDLGKDQPVRSVMAAA